MVVSASLLCVVSSLLNNAPSVPTAPAPAPTAVNVTISNVHPRLDVNGEIVNSHDGTIRWIDGAWWLHAASYGAGNCDDPPHKGCDRNSQNCGFQRNHNVSIYRSPNLKSGTWEFMGNAVECEKWPDCGILYRPHLVWNPVTKLYVVIFNYVTQSNTGSRNGVATSPHPAGPWTMANPQMKTARPMNTQNHNGSVGDFDVFVDDDGAAYMAYSYGPMSIEKLTPDYLNSEPRNASFPLTAGGHDWQGTCLHGTCLPEDFCEAPSLWKRGDTYYLTTGHCCCFCYQGSGMIVYTASHPLGPWLKQPGPADLGCIANSSVLTPSQQHPPTLPITAMSAPNQGCSYKGANARSVSQAQQNFVFTVHTTAGLLHVWTGDRWMQASDGKKAHEPQYWAPLKFDEHGKLLPLASVTQFTFEMVLPQPELADRTVGDAL